MNTEQGYMHALYAQSFYEFGEPHWLPNSKGWILIRDIPRTPYKDAMGCYPLFCCQDWSKLSTDLSALDPDLVSLGMVTDPFGNFQLEDLQACFTHVIPFKYHYVTDCTQPPRSIISRNVYKNAHKALKKLAVDICEDPEVHLQDWIRLYDQLITRHQIKGIQAFSDSAFASQLKIPGSVLFRAQVNGETVGATLWYIQGDVAYGHLAAFDERGYSLNASYGLDYLALQYFHKRVHWMDFGGGPGVTVDELDGLSQYKKSWATTQRPVYFCGRVHNSQRYAELSQPLRKPLSNYFPVYRQGEFTSSEEQ